MSSAWTLSFFALHNWLLTKFDPALGRELFAPRPWVLAPAPLAPTGTLTAEDGGYRVSGRWEWATGVLHADWIIVHALGMGDRGPITRFCVIPAWLCAPTRTPAHEAGMARHPEHAVVLDDVFVPAHRTLDGRRVMRPGGGRAHRFIEYPTLPALAFVAAAPALGAAERAVELFRTRARDRVLAFTLR